MLHIKLRIVRYIFFIQGTVWIYYAFAQFAIVEVYADRGLYKKNQSLPMLLTAFVVLVISYFLIFSMRGGGRKSALTKRGEYNKKNAKKLYAEKSYCNIVNNYLN